MKNTYLSSLVVDDDAEAIGVQRMAPNSTPIFFGDIVVKRAIVFPDGTTQSSAPKATGSNVDAGTF